jgi:glycosyltransferase involved in cell wall biosynthesis
VLSAWAASSVIHDYGVAAERVAVLGAGANVDRVLPRAASRSAPYVLFVGADWRQKGGPLLLDAFQLARRDVPELRLVVVGCRPGIPHAGVEVVGPLLRSDASQYQRLLELYARATCFSILPSFDAFPNVLLEAGLFGVPVVSTREGSRPEAVLHGQTGLLASRRDATEIAGLILRLIRDPDEADRMGRRASAWVASRFTWPLVARRLLDLIARDLEAGPP